LPRYFSLVPENYDAVIYTGSEGEKRLRELMTQAE